jgi:hypothetical protein
MGKGYRIVEPILLDPLMVESKHHEQAIALFCWLIEELYKELGNELTDIEIDVISVMFLGPGYPALGLYSEREIPSDTAERIRDLVEYTANTLLQERPISELVKFIAESNVNWKTVKAKIMDRR